MSEVQIKRIYKAADKADGVRLLVDRLWPRGVKKEAAHIDEWMKAVAPSDELRKSFHQGNLAWDEFEAKYVFELKNNTAVKDLLDIIHKNPKVTLLYAARDEHQNHALILQQFITKTSH
ncbi:MAG TPA: DUF488 family protein [Mucilaginibacter sp.]|jgi:uncharacterized protein YeaO (DUF488 family)